MFPFRQPPSKLEIAKKGVSDAAQSVLEAIPTTQIEEKLQELKKSAALAATAATGAAHHAGEIASQKLGELQSSAQSVAHSAHLAGQNAAAVAGTKASDASQNVRESAATARETLGEKVKTAVTFKERLAQDFKVGGKESQNAKAVALQAAEREAEALKARAAAVEAKKQARDLEKAADSAQKEAELTASQAKQAALKAAEELKAAEKAAREQAQAEAEKAEREARALLEAKAEEQAEDAKLEVKSALESERVAEKISKKAAKAQAKALAQAEKARNKTEREFLSRDDNEAESGEIQIADSGSKWAWILLGLALGAVLALLLAPTSGRRSRAAIKDRLGKVSDGVVDAATSTSDKAVDIAQRVDGLAHKVEAKMAADSEGEDDATIADRVRSTLGHHDIAKTIERLNIDCIEGVVTLRGPHLEAAQHDAILTAVKTIPGVKDVIADFGAEASSDGESS